MSSTIINCLADLAEAFLGPVQQAVNNSYAPGKQMEASAPMKISEPKVFVSRNEEKPASLHKHLGRCGRAPRNRDWRDPFEQSGKSQVDYVPSTAWLRTCQL